MRGWGRGCCKHGDWLVDAIGRKQNSKMSSQVELKTCVPFSVRAAFLPRPLTTAANQISVLSNDGSLSTTGRRGRKVAFGRLILYLDIKKTICSHLGFLAYGIVFCVSRTFKYHYNKPPWATKLWKAANVC